MSLAKIQIELLPDEKRQAIPVASKLVFGRTFADHMFIQEFAHESWGVPRVEPLRPLNLHPGALVFHYAQECFEGLKAFHTVDKRVVMFRPQKNIVRMNASGARLAMPAIDEIVFLRALKALVRVERRLIPSEPGTSLYLRPTYVGTEPVLGVRASSTYLFYILACPVGPYNPEGFHPTKLLIQKEFIRAAPGGTGAIKCGGNYAASLLAGTSAKKKGCSQVLWLDAIERKYVEEAGGMNVFFVLKGTVYTAPLSRGTILPGITRDSIIQLCHDMGIPVKEESLAIDDIAKAIHDGSLSEVFESGTAASVSPVGELIFEDEHLVVAGGKVGPITLRLYETLVGIQRGTVPDTHHWLVDVDSPDE